MLRKKALDNCSGSPDIWAFVGTRPEAVKVAPVVNALRSRGVKTGVCATGQHTDLALQQLEIFGLRPDHVVDSVESDSVSSKFQQNLESKCRLLLGWTRPKYVLVQGDTSSALVVARASNDMGIKVAHLEAGLRTHNLQSPWPEEANRIEISMLASLHFCPSGLAQSNLLAEGVCSESIFVTGNSGVDALVSILPSLSLPPNGSWKRTQGPVIVTAHRRENIGFRLHDVCQALLALSDRYPELDFVFPAHPNPRVARVISQHSFDNSRIRVIPPLRYSEMIPLLISARLVLTDSGGVQEDAVTLNADTLVLREYTERPEGVAAGVAHVIGTSEEEIVQHGELLLDKTPRPAGLRFTYGDSRCSRRVAELLAHFIATPNIPPNFDDFSPTDTLHPLTQRGVNDRFDGLRHEKLF